MSFRIERINSEIQKCLSDIISNRVKNPQMTEMVSILSVNTAKDLKTAKVYVSIYGDKEKSVLTFEALKASAGFIRHELSVDFKDLRTIPQLTFILDESAQYSDRINTLIEQINEKK